MTTLEQTIAVPAAANAAAPLSAADRCDSCGAQAYVRACLHGSELLFCAHHARKHESSLREIAESWHDESHRLLI